MKKNISSFIYFGIAAVIAAASYFIFCTNKSVASSNVEKVEQNLFEKDNANQMKVDTFVMLVNKAYGPLATIAKTSSQLNISMTQANQVTKDFFNGNDALLKCNLAKDGFLIQYNETNKSLQAQFVIKNGAVTVPNDVLIKLLDKTENAKKII
jgi:hypothetical protein